VRIKTRFHGVQHVPHNRHETEFEGTIEVSEGFDKLTSEEKENILRTILKEVFNGDYDIISFEEVV
jgi:hypothetical protein